MQYFVVKYSGPFGFIKPWTAVRDSETYSQQFLTQSMLEGIEKKLFPELLNDSSSFGNIVKILRYRINYQGLTMQQERTWSKGGFSFSKEKGVYKTNLGIINRGVLLNPNLYLAFKDINDAMIAMQQNLCLCRNEDIVMPELITEMSDNNFEEIDGFELIFSDSINGFKVGHNRFSNAKEMYGELKIYGNPIRS